MRYRTSDHRNAMITDVFATAGVFSFSLLVLGLILIRSGLFPIS
jgi:hypothetical protein